MFFSKVQRQQLERATNQLLELEASKKRLEIERDQINLELENLRSKMQMAIEKETHKQTLTMESQKAIFEREKEIWVKEKQELLDKARREKTEFEERLTKDTEIKMMEAISLTKLESQQAIAQAKLDVSREINAVKTEMAQQVAKIQQDESEKFYNKLTSSFQEMQMNGDKNSKFVQELALRILDKTPSANVDVSVRTKQLESSQKDVN
jgi:hypothetical protein